MNRLLCYLLPLFIAQVQLICAQETATVPDGHQRMVELLKKAGEVRPQLPFLGEKQMLDLQEYLLQNANRLPKQEALDLIVDLAVKQTAHGLQAEAIANLEQAGRIAEQNPHLIDMQMIIDITSAETYLRQAETENCCAKYTVDSCILPLQGGAIHSRREGSEKAIQHLLKALSTGKKGVPYFDAVWLLNLAYMTLGEYPDGVPRTYLMPPSYFKSEIDFPRFLNISEKLGIDRESLAGGAVGEDFDGDHDIDLIVTSWDPLVSPVYYENLGNEGFRDRTKEAGIADLPGGLNIVQADYDNDGDTDLYILRGAWMGALSQQPNSLLQNDGTGKFRDVTFDAGLEEFIYPSQTAGWADYDLDGDLDLFVGNEYQSMKAPCQLFRNNGNGTFTDVAAEAGVLNNTYCKGMVWSDIDNDRYPDIIISNINAPNQIYRNSGEGTFTEIAKETGNDLPVRSFSLWAWDYNNDGNQDLFINSYTDTLADFAVRSVGEPSKQETAVLLQGRGDGTFRNVSEKAGITFPTLTMGCNIGDLNNDGFEDAYLGSGNPDLMSILPNRLLINQGGYRFADATMASGMGHLQKGHAIVFADFDQDGDLDVFNQLGGALPVDVYRDALFENPGFPGAWIRIKAEGTQSNRSGIGARIRVRTRTGQITREFHREVSTGGSFGANPLIQHLGLGNAETIEEIEIHWPASDVRQVFREIPLRHLVILKEGIDQAEILEQTPFDWSSLKKS